MVGPMYPAFGWAVMEIVRYFTHWPGPNTPETAVGLGILVVLGLVLSEWRLRRDMGVLRASRAVSSRSR